MMWLSKLNLFIFLLCALIISGGCKKSSNRNSANRTFEMEIKDTSGRIIASGTMSLPTNIMDTAQYTGSYKTNKIRIPEKPSNNEEYAIYSLSRKNGIFSGVLRGGTFYIYLHPRIDDDDIYFEGQYNEQLIKGNCIYQSYAGNLNFGTFEAKAAGK